MGSRRVVHLEDGTVQITDDRDVEDAQAGALIRLQRYYEATLAAGRAYDEHVFQIDQPSLLNFSGQVQFAMIVKAGFASWPESFGWITMDNSLYLLSTPDEMIALGLDIAGYVATLTFTNRAYKDAIAALTSVADCDAFDVTQGWPAN